MFLFGAKKQESIHWKQNCLEFTFFSNIHNFFKIQKVKETNIILATYV